ncbi:MAG: hypothetical protein PHH47_13055 [Gallionella sp.]|nr:hypothetical protein [Gallionella sp.]MDD4947438.1 hypothetical protein [Gallionella sp.]MDD5612441.1 hypothetical protein [Gallionella sp.]
MGNADLSVLYVRINLKTGAERFFRAGLAFDREWQKVEVDAATAQRLQEEQMLEVSEGMPADYADVTGAAAPSVPGAPIAPTDPAERMAEIMRVIANLDGAASLYTAGGAPKTSVIEAATGWPVSAIERDAAWAEFNKAAQ